MIKLDQTLTHGKENMIRIATRNSPLALWQANFIKQELQQLHAGLEVVIVGMTTQGDQLLQSSLATVGGKGLFLKELEVSLLNNETDIAVHSMKDVPFELPQGLEIPVVCERGDARDAFVSNNYQNLYALPDGSRVGTSSLRRVAQLKNAFPMLEFIALRGNVNTRLAKLDDGEYDAIILAAAGLIRLGFVHRIKQYITPELSLPAVGQGIIGIECRSDDDQTKQLIQGLHNRESALFLAAERAMNYKLQGGCQVPVAGYAEIVKGKIRMRGMVGEIDGSTILFSNRTSDSLEESSAKEMGEQVAQELLDKGAGKILQELRGHDSSSNNNAKPVVVLTRQTRFLGNMATILETLDYQPIAIETLTVEPILDSEVTELFKNLERFTDIVFVSRNAVEFGMSIIQQQQKGIPKSTQVLSVGAETAKQLYKHGVDAFFPDHGSGADALLGVEQLANLQDRKILIVRGQHGLVWPAEEMRQRGAIVEHANVYSQNMPSDGADGFKNLLENHQQIEGIFLHSAQSATNFMQIVRKDIGRFAKTVLVVGSERIAEVVKTLGWRSEIRVAQSPSNKHMMISFSGSHNTKL